MGKVEMTRPRILDVPYVTIGPDPTMCYTRLPTGQDSRGQDTFLETSLTEDEARAYGLALLFDAERAKAAKRSRR